MKIGDKVRFLSATGGGRVAGFKGKDIVLVEDEDGFQIPTKINEVVVVGDEDYSSRNIVEHKMNKSQTKVEDSDYEPADLPISFKAPVEERENGEKLTAYLAFVPIDIREISSTRFELYFVNDCNYYLHYVYMVADGDSWILRSIGEVEPNTKLFIEEFGREDLVDLERVCIQLVAYKRNKPFLLKSVVEAKFRIDAVKFYKLNTFKENDFFEQNALLYTIIDNDNQERPLTVDADKLRREMISKVTADSVKKDNVKSHVDKKVPIVVDLHANVLLETTVGMSSIDILNYQLEVFRKTMNQYIKSKGTKIVFIHGKGEGVLRHALINELRYRYKHCLYQDASFQEYGYGATQVIIR